MRNFWRRYRRFIHKSVFGKNDFSKIDDISNWKDKLFINAVLYAFPISFIATIPSFLIAYNNRLYLLCISNIIALIVMLAVTLNNRISLQYRKLSIVIVMTFLSVILIAYLGSFGIGSVYLLALSVFISFLFSTRFSYLSIIVNLLIYAAFGTIIEFKLFNSPLIEKYTIGYWISYSINFLVFNFIIVNQVRHVLTDFELKIEKEARLKDQLKQEIVEKEIRNKLLMESEEHYKSLFLSNPFPMWIFNKFDLRFLEVNEAAIKKYGYTRQEFLMMSLKDICPEECYDFERLLANDDTSTKFIENVVQHRRSDGQFFLANVRYGTIYLHGNKAFLAIARNITQQIDHIKAIESQNEKLRRIAYLQSHVIRAPLARIMGIASLIRQNTDGPPDNVLMNYLDISLDELDSVIRDIINDAKAILPGDYKDD